MHSSAWLNARAAMMRREVRPAEVEASHMVDLA
jgi:hypothetical protein